MKLFNNVSLLVLMCVAYYGASSVAEVTDPIVQTLPTFYDIGGTKMDVVPKALGLDIVELRFNWKDSRGHRLPFKLECKNDLSDLPSVDCKDIDDSLPETKRIRSDSQKSKFWYAVFMKRSDKAYDVLFVNEVLGKFEKLRGAIGMLKEKYYIRLKSFPNRADLLFSLRTDQSLPGKINEAKEIICELINSDTFIFDSIGLENYLAFKRQLSDISNCFPNLLGFDTKNLLFLQERLLLSLVEFDLDERYDFIFYYHNIDGFRVQFLRKGTRCSQVFDFSRGVLFNIQVNEKVEINKNTGIGFSNTISYLNDMGMEIARTGEYEFSIKILDKEEVKG